MTKAKTLDDAIAALDQRPLTTAQLAELYIERTEAGLDGVERPFLAMLKQKLLHAGEQSRAYLSGHIGSGKTTLLRKLSQDPQLAKRFFVRFVTVPESEYATLSTAQLVFMVAAELYKLGRDLGLTEFDDDSELKASLVRLHDRIYGAGGLTADQGKTSVVFDLVVIKLTQELSLSEKTRASFREFVDTDGSALIDIVDRIYTDLCLGLQRRAEHTAGPSRVVVFIDDLEKATDDKVLSDLWSINLPLLQRLRVPMLLSVPPSITFGTHGARFDHNIEHLRPAQVFKKTSSFDPMSAVDPAGVSFLRAVLEARVERDSVFETHVVERAAVFSGGVIRDFFSLLRGAALRASIDEDAHVTSLHLAEEIREQSLQRKRRLVPAMLKQLKAIHQSHERDELSQERWMNDSTILELNHDNLWFDVNPLLWQHLEHV